MRWASTSRWKEPISPTVLKKYSSETPIIRLGTTSGARNSASTACLPGKRYRTMPIEAITPTTSASTVATTANVRLLTVPLTNSGRLVMYWNQRSDSPGGGKSTPAPEVNETDTTISSGNSRTAYTRTLAAISSGLSSEPITQHHAHAQRTDYAVVGQHDGQRNHEQDGRGGGPQCPILVDVHAAVDDHGQELLANLAADE